MRGDGAKSPGSYQPDTGPHCSVAPHSVTRRGRGLETPADARRTQSLSAPDLATFVTIIQNGYPKRRLLQCLSVAPPNFSPLASSINICWNVQQQKIWFFFQGALSGRNNRGSGSSDKDFLVSSQSVANMPFIWAQTGASKNWPARQAERLFSKDVGTKKEHDFLNITGQSIEGRS